MKEIGIAMAGNINIMLERVSCRNIWLREPPCVVFVCASTLRRALSALNQRTAFHQNSDVLLFNTFKFFANDFTESGGDDGDVDHPVRLGILRVMK